jgi:hypothetical protein
MFTSSNVSNISVYLILKTVNLILITSAQAC